MTYVDQPANETVSIDGVLYPVDENGKVDYKPQVAVAEQIPLNGLEQKIEIQLGAMRQQMELDKMRAEHKLEIRLEEQNLQFEKKQIENEKISLIEKKERLANKQEQQDYRDEKLDDRESEMTNDVASFIKLVPRALNGIFKGFLSEKSTDKPVGNVDTEPRKSSPVEFSVNDIQEEFGEEEEVLEEQEPEIENTEQLQVDEPTEEKSNEITLSGNEDSEAERGQDEPSIDSS